MSALQYMEDETHHDLGDYNIGNFQGSGGEGIVTNPKTDCTLHHEQGSKLTSRSVPLMDSVYSTPENSVQAMDLPVLVWSGKGFMHQAELELAVYLK